MKFIKQTLLPSIFASLLLLVFVLPMVSFAENHDKGSVTSPSDKGSVTSPSKSDPNKGMIRDPLGGNGPKDIPVFIRNVLKGALKILLPVVALAIIYSGFLFVTAMGNSEKLTRAKNALLYSLIGAAILLGSWAIANLIVETINGLS